MKKQTKAKKYKQIIDYYSIPLYNCKIVVIKNPDPEKISKRFDIQKERIEDDWKEGIYGCSYGGGRDKKTGEYVQLILIYPHENTLQLVNTCSHEALHATEDILHWKGMKLCNETHEPYAYMVGYITEQIYKTATKK